MSFFKKILHKSDNSRANEIPPGKLKKQLAYLREVTYTDVGFFHLIDYETWAKVVTQYDGDSFTVVFFYNEEPLKFKIRLNGIDTAEKRSKNLAEKAYAIKARDRLKELIGEDLIWLKCCGVDKYGRILAEASLQPDDINTFNEILINENLAYEYHGGTKKEFEEWAPQEAQNLN